MAQVSEPLSTWQRSALDAALAYAQTALASAEQLLLLNLEAARKALEQHGQAARDLLETTDADELMRLRSRLAQSSMQQTAAYAQNIYELVSQAQAQLARLAEQQFSRVNDDMLKRAEQEAPGSDLAAAAVRSSLQASAAMMENLNRATRQFADLSEASIRAATANMVSMSERGAGAPRDAGM